MEWLLFAGLIVGNFLTFGTIKVVKDNKTREFSLGRVVNYLNERYKAMKDPLEDHNKYLEQQARQAREETDELLEPYDHALRNINEENRLKEQKITKTKEIIEAEKRSKELQESMQKLAKIARESGISLEEIEDGREYISIEGNRVTLKTKDEEKTIVYPFESVKGFHEDLYGKINELADDYKELESDQRMHDFLKSKGYGVSTNKAKIQERINTKIRAHNQPIIEKKLLRNLEDIVERIDKEDKRPLKHLDKIARNPDALKIILKHHKPNTFKYEIASKIFMIIMYELSYEEIVTDTMIGTHESISYATNLDIKTVLEYISVTELRNELRRHEFSTDNKTDNSIIRIHHNRNL